MIEVQTRLDLIKEEVISLLKDLIAIPSFSREEGAAADAIYTFLEQQGMDVQRHLNNVWVRNKYYDPTWPVILLNSHLDTVKPVEGWNRDPFNPLIEEGVLYGLGSNDAGGALVSLLGAFLYFHDKQSLNANLIFAATAEEEISGKNGIESLLPELGELSLAIVGEPTQMYMAIAEKGLMVLDCTAKGKAGHAARDEGENAIYNAMQDIAWFSTYRFQKESDLLGPVKMSVTQIQAGRQHNIVPDECRFTVDIRVNDQYTHEEILEEIRKHVQSEVLPRSTRIRPSFISGDHPIVTAGLALGRKTFGSSTTSDQALIPYPSIKIGPGDSARSHTADEYIRLDEIREGTDIYIQMLSHLLKL